MSKPLRYTVSSILRQTPEQAQAVEEERKHEDRIPPYAEMCRRLIDEALAHREHGREIRRLYWPREARTRNMRKLQSGQETGDSGQP